MKLGVPILRWWITSAHLAFIFFFPFFLARSRYTWLIIPHAYHCVGFRFFFPLFIDLSHNPPVRSSSAAAVCCLDFMFFICIGSELRGGGTKNGSLPFWQKRYPSRRSCWRGHVAGVWDTVLDLLPGLDETVTLHHDFTIYPFPLSYFFFINGAQYDQRRSFAGLRFAAERCERVKGLDHPRDFRASG